MAASRRWTRIAAAAAVPPMAGAVGLYLLALLLAPTRFVAARGSDYLTRLCGERVTVEQFSLSGLSVAAHGITVRASVPGSPPLLAIRAVSVSPSLTGLLAGRNEFSAIGVTGLSVDLRRESDGSWNWRRLLGRITGGKERGRRETRIGLLTLRDGAVTIDGTRIDGISFSLRDFSTRAAAPSTYEVSFRDRKGRPLRISGKAELEEKALDLRVAASGFDLEELLPKAPGELGLDLAVTVRNGDISASAAGSVATTVPVKGTAAPVRATFRLKGGASLARDEAWLDAATVDLDPGVRLTGGARMTALRGSRDVTADLAATCDDLGKPLRLLLPEGAMGDMAAGGTVSATARLEGSVTTRRFGGSAAVTLRNGSVSRQRQPLARNLSGSLALRRSASGWEGTARIGSPEGDALIGRGDARGTILLSPTFRPMEASLDSLSAVIGGIPVAGTATWRSGGPAPLTAEIRAAKVPLTLLGKYLPPSRGVVSGGTGSFALRGSGSSPRLFSGEWSAAVESLSGTFAGKRIDGTAGSGSGTFATAARSVSGRLTLSGRMDSQPISAASAFDALPDSIRIGRATLQAGAATARLDAAEVSLPSGGSASVTFRGLAGEGGDLRVAGGSGTLRGRIAAEGPLRWLEGKGDFSFTGASFRGAAAGPLQGSLAMTRASQELALAGELFGGRVSATGHGDLLSPGRRGSFRIVAPALHGDLLAPLLPKWSYAPSGGTVEAAAEGEFGRDAGLSCRFTLAGRDIAVDRGGRTVANGIGVAAHGNWSKALLVIDEATLAPAGGGVVRLSGRLARPAAADREGDFTLELKETPIPAVVAAAPALLPRPLQEAEATGSCALSARISLRGKTTAVEGEATLRSGSIRLPSQKLAITGISGRVPISVLTGTGRTPGSELHGYRRDSHGRLVETLRSRGTGRPAVTIEKVVFGPVEAGPTRLFLRTDQGRIRLSLLETTLFGGDILGEGYLGFDGRPVYGIDLAVDGVSLRRLCETFPPIKGYISGKVDGVISLQSQKPGLEGLLGFVSLWTRETRDEKMLVSKEFLQRLAGKKLRGIFFRDDRPYDRGGITAYLEKGYLTFDRLDLVHTNFFGVTDLSVSVAPVQNRISLEHLLTSIREAAARGKKVGTGEEPPAEAPQTDFKWAE